MARVTVEDCLEHAKNRFELVQMAAHRVQDIKKGATPLVTCSNREIVTALREIADGKVIVQRPADLVQEGE